MRIIEDVLDVGRIISGKLRLEISPTNVRRRRRGGGPGRAAGGRRQAGDGSTSRSARSVGVIAADAERLQQIVWNLLSNALKFTRKGRSRARSPSSRVGLARSSCGSATTGRGSGRSSCRTSSSRSARRTDRRRVATGGSVSVWPSSNSWSSRTGERSPPRAPAKEKERRSRRAACTCARDGRRAGVSGSNLLPPIGAADVRLDGVRVLVVDDDEDTRELVGHMLSEQGAGVSVASSAEEAIRPARAKPSGRARSATSGCPTSTDTR